MIRAPLILLVAIVLVYGTIVASTGIWTFTGHCCGIYVPFITDNWDKCMPVQDNMWPDKYLASGHCDRTTWRRVP